MNTYIDNNEDDGRKENHNGCTGNAVWIFVFIIIWQLANAYNWWGLWD